MRLFVELCNCHLYKNAVIKTNSDEQNGSDDVTDLESKDGKLGMRHLRDVYICSEANNLFLTFVVLTFLLCLALL